VGAPDDAVDARYERERAFHDERFGETARGRTAKFYADATGRIRYHALLAQLAPEHDVLEIGCGRGSVALRLAADDARVFGIDLSPVAIELAEQRARRAHVEHVRFRAMNAEALDLDAASVDLVCGSGVLHHLDLDRAYAEVARVLRRDGCAVFHEPLAHNPLIEWYRRRTPGERSHDEHPLRMADIERARSWFGLVHAEHFDLLALAAPFLPPRVRTRVVPWLRRADAALFRALPFLRRYAWVVVLRLERPVVDVARAERASVAPEDLADELVEGTPVTFAGQVADEDGRPGPEPGRQRAER
jgi:SAM-dependent methyltransferase